MHPKYNSLRYSGYINGIPALVFDVKEDTEAMWVLPTEYAFEFMRFLAAAYERN